MSRDAQADRPLDGIRVLELGHVVAAPYASLMLSDLGADVVKVEHPDHGDQMRVAGDTAQSIFDALNRDKQSVALDLKDAVDREAFLDLVGETDLVIENFSPGVLERLNLNYDRLSGVNEELILVSIKGFGDDGPYADRVATDPIVQAMSGLMSVTGHRDRPPARAGTSVIDFAAAQNAVVATMIALWNREESDRGEHLTIPLFRTGVSLMSYWLVYQQQYQENPQRNGASHSLYAPYDVFPTADDEYIFIGATSDRHWDAIRKELGLNLDYDSRGERLANRSEISEAVKSVTAELPRSELVDRFLSASVPIAPVNELSDLVNDPHLIETRALTTINTTTADKVVVPTTIPWLQATASANDPPALGADTEAVLRNLDTEKDRSG